MPTGGRGRVCVITGGSSGIGLATAKRFVAAGDHVIICGRDVQRLNAATAELASIAPSKLVGGRQVDVGQPGAVAELIQWAHGETGRVDVLFNNAGYPPCDEIARITRVQFDQAIAVNVAATFEGTQAAWPIMAEQGGGTIVNMSSMAAVDPFEGFSVYAGCKAWVEAFSKAVAAEGQPSKIRVVCVRPGAVETPMLRGLFPQFPADQVVAPDQVANVVFELCDAQASTPTEPVNVVVGD